ncbi:hypothetical protein D3C75_626920 [compost metagenome]
MISAVNTTVQAHHHTDGVLGDRFRGIGWNAHHRQAEFFGRVEIDVVKARAAQRDKLHTLLFKLFENRTATVVIDEDTHPVTAMSSFGCFFG